jgi:hypothetical protein
MPLATEKGSVMTNLTDFDLQLDEPVEPVEPVKSEREKSEPEKSGPELLEVRSAGRIGIRPRSELNLPHPPGPVGLGGPRTRVWIKHPPGPVGLV